MSRHDDFSWADVEDDICVAGQATIACYLNPKNHIVVRQEAQFHPDEDHWIVVHPNHALALARAILDKAGLNMEIVHVSQLRIQNGAGEVLQPFPDQATVDAGDRAGRAADAVVADDDHGDRADHAAGVDQDDEDPAERKRQAATERQRRRREKQRQRDGATDSVTWRDAERDSVTTAPALPELDLHGGENTALAH